MRRFRNDGDSMSVAVSTVPRSDAICSTKNRLTKPITSTLTTDLLLYGYSTRKQGKMYYTVRLYDNSFHLHLVSIETHMSKFRGKLPSLERVRRLITYYCD